jgi:hypothetical protein
MDLFLLRIPGFGSAHGNVRTAGVGLAIAVGVMLFGFWDDSNFV